MPATADVCERGVWALPTSAPEALACQLGKALLLPPGPAETAATR